MKGKKKKGSKKKGKGKKAEEEERVDIKREESEEEGVDKVLGEKERVESNIKGEEIGQSASENMSFHSMKSGGFTPEDNSIYHSMEQQNIFTPQTHPPENNYNLQPNHSPNSNQYSHPYQQQEQEKPQILAESISTNENPSALLTQNNIIPPQQDKLKESENSEEILDQD